MYIHKLLVYYSIQTCDKCKSQTGMMPDITFRFQVMGQSVGTKHGFMANVVYLRVKCSEMAYMLVAERNNSCH